MQTEVEALHADMKNASRTDIAGISFYAGELYGQPAVVAKCGVGKVFAAICAQTMILRFGVGQILNTGVAGTLTDRLGQLDIALASTVVQHDMDTSPVGDPVGMISGINVIEIAASEKINAALASAAAEAGIRTLSGVIASGDQFIADPARKAFIRDTFGAIACEMEGAAIGQVCYINRIPFAVIRSVSDSATGDAGMEYPEMVRRAAARSADLIRRYLTRL